MAESEISKVIEGSNRLPYEGEKLTQHLINLLNAHPTPEKLIEIKRKFEQIYTQLPEIATHILTEYNQLLHKWDLDPGRVNLYMVGGRVKGKPLKEDSDIDLIIGVENPSQSAEVLLFDRFPGDPIAAMDFRLMLKQQLLAKVNAVCAQRVIPVPNEFHILNYGTKVPKANINSPSSLLIATYPPQANEGNILK